MKLLRKRPKPPAYAVHFLVQKDLLQLVALENAQDEKLERLSKEALANELRSRPLLPPHACLVAQSVQERQIVAYLFYRWTNEQKGQLLISRLVVHPDERYGEAEREILAAMTLRGSNAKCVAIYHCRETDLGQQIILADLGFRATSVVRGHFVDTGEDAYRFSYGCVIEATMQQGAL